MHYIIVTLFEKKIILNQSQCQCVTVSMNLQFVLFVTLLCVGLYPKQTLQFGKLRNFAATLINNIENAVQNHNNRLKDEMITLQQGFAKTLQIKNYKPMDTSQIEKILDDLKVKERLVPMKSVNLGDNLLCSVCQILIDNLQKNAITVEVVGKAICDLYITLSTWTMSDFCAETIRINKPILEYIIQNSDIFDPKYACSVLLQNRRCYYNHKALKWSLDVPDDDKKIPQINRDPEAKPLKILHLTDFHISPDYEVNGVSKCGYPICCKKGLGSPLLGRDAGKWGDYNCDISTEMFVDTLNYINNTHKDIDWIYFTGDVVDHSIWQASYLNNSALLSYTFKTLDESFPNKTILPVIGNHESIPLNVFAPPEITENNFSQRWLYILLATLWTKWLSEEALTTIEKQGYYSHQIHTNLKIIALNNNVCYKYNWWVLYDTDYFKEQLDFLKKELTEAENNGVFVHIIAHVPPGNKECLEPWEVSYNKLVSRFSHIIKGHFYGHTHTDELKVFYSKTNNKPNSIGYNGASLTPFTKFNPNYKIFTVDPDTYDVLDVDTYTFNLTEANLHPNRSPIWYKLYSMKDAYGLTEVTPQNLDKLAKNMLKNKTLSTLYWRYYVRDGDASLKDGCDANCQKEIVCQITTTESLYPHENSCVD